MIDQVLVAPAGVAFASSAPLDPSDYGIDRLTLDPDTDKPRDVYVGGLEGPTQFGEHIVIFWPRRAWQVKSDTVGSRYALLPGHRPDEGKDEDGGEEEHREQVMSTEDWFAALYRLRHELDGDPVIDEQPVGEEPAAPQPPAPQRPAPEEPVPHRPPGPVGGDPRFPLITASLVDEAPDAPIAVRAQHIMQRVFPQKGTAVATLRDLERFTEQIETQGVRQTIWRRNPVAVAGVAGGELSGEQAAVVAFVETVIEKSTPLIASAEPLVVAADPENVEAAELVLTDLLNRTLADVSRPDGWQTAILATRADALETAIRDYGLELGMLVETSDEDDEDGLRANVGQAVNSAEAARLTEFQILHGWIERLVDELRAIVSGGETIASGTYGIQESATVAAGMAATLRGLVRQLTGASTEVLGTIPIGVEREGREDTTLTVAALFDELETLPERAGILEPAGVTAARASQADLDLMIGAIDALRSDPDTVLSHPMIHTQLGHIRDAVVTAKHRTDDLVARKPWIVRHKLGSELVAADDRHNGAAARA